ncbi:hypothetical protein [Streptomyces kronopolitis]|uniref:hypothetical protein n=1 Tax=Streptomyces kronopolitis TaxID=1612435 RepID=UPI003D98E5A2
MSIPTTQVLEWLTGQHIAAITTAVSVLCIAVAIAAVRMWQIVGPNIGGAVTPTTGDGTKARRKLSAGTLAAVAAFIICTSVSLNTSYRFTGDAAGLAMTSTVERLLSCAAYESLMAMCVLGARERMAESKSPGWFGGAVWIFAALSAIPAGIEGDGLTAATAVRVIVGSFGSALAAHSALGLDLKHRTGADSEAPTAVLLRDLRERLMARFGLIAQNLSAQQIAQERALSQAVELHDEYKRLSDADKGKRKGTKIARKLAAAQDAAGIATDEAQKALYVARVALRENATALVISEDQNPWQAPAAATIDQYAARIAQVEALADEEEAALLQPGTAQLQALPQQRAEEVPADDPDACFTDVPQPREGRGRTAAARGPVGQTVTVPWSEADEAPAEDAADNEPTGDEDAADVMDLDSYETKKEKLLALFQVRIQPGDQRSTNAITESLLAELAERGVKYDRGAANREIGKLREPATVEPARERCSA